MVTKEQKAFLHKKEKEIGQFEFIKLKHVLLQYGGDAVVPVYVENLNKILNHGQLFNSKKVKIVRGTLCQCHSNSIKLYRIINCNIATGWALSSDDKLWRRHSWCVDTKETILETTIRREMYYGYLLDESEVDEFVLNYY